MTRHRVEPNDNRKADACSCFSLRIERGLFFSPPALLRLDNNFFGGSVTPMPTTKTVAVATFAKALDQVAKTISAMLFAIALSGCGGIVIKPAATDWRSSAVSKEDEGYLVYEPRVVVKVELSYRCPEPGEGGACNGEPVLGCAVGDPFVVPDYNKPYVVRFKRGFAGSESSLKFASGWLLSEATSATDNTALFDLLGAAAAAAAADDGCKPGLYAMDPKVTMDEGVKLVRVWPTRE